MKKVQPGQPLEIKATTWNAFIDAAEYVKNIQSNQNSPSLRNGLHNGVVLIKNGESATYPQFSAMVLADIIIKPAANLREFKEKIPAFVGCRMIEAYEGYPYAILLEPIASGKIGRALLLGIVPVQLSVLDPDHQFAEPVPGSNAGAMQSADTGVARILWRAGNSGSQWCMIQLGGAGSGGGDDRVTLCRVTGGSSGAGYNVNLYAEGKDSASTGSGILYVPELALNSTIPSGSWLIAHKASLKMTGGNET